MGGCYEPVPREGVTRRCACGWNLRGAARWHGSAAGALTGLAATGGVITSAGAVLAGTFAALGTLPVTFLAELGFAVAFGVLLDTLVVRSVLVTALNLDLGRWVWWPSRLYRQASPPTEILNERAATVR
jgi:putative drug exporter of the RND superfamily